MSRPLASHLFISSRLGNSRTTRLLSQSATRWAEFKADAPRRAQALPKTQDFLQSILDSTAPSRDRLARKPSTTADFAQSIAFRGQQSKPIIDTSALSGWPSEPPQRREDELEPFHFHVYSHKHNTHITCTKPNREPIISLSCGNIGYRKSRRGTFDSAYSLTKYVLERLIHGAWPTKIHRLELVLRGFGQGREAAVKVLMSPEGKVLRDKIVRVADSTRIKFGGTRSEKPRRL